MKRVGIVKDDLFLKHVNGFQHPECPERLEAVYSMLEDTGLISNLEILDPVDATDEQIMRVHTETYYNSVKNTKGVERFNFDPDTSSNPFTYEAALRGSGGFISGLDKILDNELDIAFALPRPPGHHAEADRAMGFCFFNHVAVAAAHLLASGIEKVLILDWDVHHGNGTQHIFYNNPDVLFASIHQFPFYPGTGSLNEVGTGDGEGFTVNIPVPPMLVDGDYNKLFDMILTPVIDQFKPGFILVSAGFDAYFIDPLGGMQITDIGFAHLTRFVMNAAEKHSEGKLALVLEGGYNIQGLSSINKLVFEELLDINKTEIIIPDSSPSTEFVVEGVLSSYSKYWKFG
ncbi:MAG: histone deacetylase family protein [Thermodesulfobacteriota bacterium]